MFKYNIGELVVLNKQNSFIRQCLYRSSQSYKFVKQINTISANSEIGFIYERTIHKKSIHFKREIVNIEYEVCFNKIKILLKQDEIRSAYENNKTESNTRIFNNS